METTMVKKWLFYFNFGGSAGGKRIESIQKKTKGTREKLSPIWGSLEMVQKGEGKFPSLNRSRVVVEIYA